MFCTRQRRLRIVDKSYYSMKGAGSQRYKLFFGLYFVVTGQRLSNKESYC